MIQITQHHDNAIALTSDHHVLHLSLREEPGLFVENDKVSAFATLYHRSWGGLDAIDCADLLFVPRVEAMAWIEVQAARMLEKM